MAVDDDGERTRCSCLATVRYTVVTVVSLLATAVVIMVITVGVRPGKIQLSVLQGHVETSSLWSRRDITIINNPGLGARRGPYSRLRPRDQAQNCLYEDRCSEPYGTRTGRSYVSTSYEAAPYLNLGVTMSAFNPSGRNDITCDNITIRVLDMPDPDAPLNLSAMVEVAELRLQRGFLVERQSSHTLRRWHSVTNTAVLSYIARTYGGVRSFSAMVQVNATITAVFPYAKISSSKNVSQLCWPVSVGEDNPGSSAKAVTCKASEDINYGAVGGQLPAPAPAPTAG